MTDVELFEAFQTYQQARALAPSTIKRRRISLARFARFMAPGSVLTAQPADIDEWLAKLTSPRTRHGYRSDLQCFFRWASRRGFAEANPVALTDGVRVPKAVPKPIPAEVIAEALRIGSGRVQLAATARR